MIRWKDQFRPKSLSSMNHIVKQFSFRYAVLFAIIDQIKHVCLKSIDEMSHLDYRPLYYKTFYISFDP